MCGIFGYIGEREVVPLLIEGLKKLEYRGYDSAGVAVLTETGIWVEKCPGKINDLEEVVSRKSIHGTAGISHTRWATHGQVCEENSHPFSDCKGKFAVVHNGIIENYQTLKKKLQEEGHEFTSATDTEVIVHLIEKHWRGDLDRAVREALSEVEGSFALAAMSLAEPDCLVVARRGSPLIIGIGEKEYFVASDIPAILKYTGRIVILEENEIGVLRRQGLVIKNLAGQELAKDVELVSWDPVAAEKDGYAHFMLKEIHEQPRAIRDTFKDRAAPDRGEITFENLKLTPSELKKINRIVITACGTSWHAGLVGEYLIEQFARIPTEVEYAAEFRYRDPIIDKNCLVIAISQSGETADTLGAIARAKAGGARTLAIVNAMASSIARECEGVIYTHAGPEIGVASTKAFTTQLTVLYLLALHLGQLKGILSPGVIKALAADLLEIPPRIETLFTRERYIEEIADRFYHKENALYLGRGKGFPIALEGALKLKEISYIHAEGYPAAEMKHGPIALIDPNMPVVVIALQGRRYEKIIGNIEEVKARGGIVIAVATEGDTEIQEKADEVIYIPDCPEPLTSILAIIPLQLLAYYIAVKRGCHVDQPRNLAKSVTVE